jgi:delta(3,5)-delta(2,4)-dienoyl-CoA isomerase
LIAGGLELAKLIATKSPIAVQGSKVNLVFSRDHSVDDGLKFIVIINISSLNQS